MAVCQALDYQLHWVTGAGGYAGSDGEKEIGPDIMNRMTMTTDPAAGHEIGHNRAKSRRKSPDVGQAAGHEGGIATSHRKSPDGGQAAGHEGNIATSRRKSPGGGHEVHRGKNLRPEAGPEGEPKNPPRKLSQGEGLFEIVTPKIGVPRENAASPARDRTSRQPTPLVGCSI